MRTSNLFLNTRKLTSSKEDHLTEFLAALITMSEPFNVEFSQLLLGEYATQNGWEDPIIASVETQVSYPGTNCCPDMRFTLGDGHVILCENKIEAPETQATEDVSALEAERAVASDDDGEVLRILHREIMAVAEHVIKGDVDQEFLVWQTVKASGWYDIKISTLGLSSIELFYSVAEEVRTKHRAGDPKKEIKAFVKDSEVSKLLLSLGETFKRHNL